jgi:hypothetical protein
VTPFPTVFGYNESRVASVGSNVLAFDKGWQAALSGAAMPAGVCFSVNAPGTAVVDFTGLLTTGPITRTNLLHNGSDGGWQLLGNPYPACCRCASPSPLPALTP